ncbi:MAG TPA: DUF2779 domain-containing protein [Paludibacter sp.]|nr:DUF2779 domain-containing protein [Paludibacter sp.]
MKQTATARITKSDFLLYCDAPRHLWAKKHGQIEISISDFEQHLAEEGNRVEALAQEFLTSVLLPQHPGDQLLWQQTYSDDSFDSRFDGLVFKPNSNTYDLYEIKSSTGVDKDIVYDVTFQAVILSKHIPVDNYYVLHLNKEYIRSGKLDLAALFIAEDISDKVKPLMPEVELLRGEALRVAQLSDPDQAEHCLSPKDCPCPALCHPELPDFSIYDIPRISRIKKLQLLERGIMAAKDIPASFDLNPKQFLVVDRAKTKTEHIDINAITNELERITFPLNFLDYETCICAIPQFNGYHPQQQIVFQYSLHKLEKSGNVPIHYEHISIVEDDPTLPLLESLKEDIGNFGTVIVWNKSFEMTMNKEMAKLHPEYAAFLEQLNERIYDLGDIVNLGYYLHPGFKGSWSIKHVLPVMVPELSYKGMAIGKGDQASLAWWNMSFEKVDQREKERLTEALLRYCELDTLAMVDIYRKLVNLIK